MKEILLNRFISYVKIESRSNPESGKTPSSDNQLLFSKTLYDELVKIGLSDVTLDNNGYLTATLPANSSKAAPTIGFIAHVDTSPDFTGTDVNPKIVPNYDGKDIILNSDSNIILSPETYPELLNYVGKTIIATNGLTLLGADDKAGIAEIVTAMEYLIQNPTIQHGKIRICFTPDEEIGEGADHFDVEQFGADFAYTMDGGEIGELEYENFNAAGAKITINGLNIHPGYGFNRMINAQLIGHQFITSLPNETPRNTNGYDGFYHLTSSKGDVEHFELNYIIRDFDQLKFEERIAKIDKIAKLINQEYGKELITVKITRQYKNMREKIEPLYHIIERAQKAMETVGVDCKIKPIRGGTDGARLSFMGLPCPNIFAGGHNFHGRYEFVPLESMMKAVEVIIEIVKVK